MIFPGIAGCKKSKKENRKTSSVYQRNSGKTIGVSMPAEELQRWNQDGQNIKLGLEKAGFTVDLKNAKNDVLT